MKTPCQIARWHLLPAITAELAAQLKTLNVQQSEIAGILGVTPAAVSQYLAKKRGVELALSKKAKQQVKRLALEIKRGRLSECGVVLGVCSVCSGIRKSGSACGVHSREFDASKNCDICTGGKHEC
ncbi:transcriptional regulator [Candidatus Micrarchaeota archaeon]|nr:transcriptional regulator [Candidatus Micrarchaeota archaeon]